MNERPLASPRATVVITTRDRPALADVALQSALGQTQRDVEVVVVDDGSSPRYEPAIADSRVRVVRHDAPRGVCAARNSGIAIARGEWIAFLDDDDRLAPTMLARALGAADASALPAPRAVNVAVQLTAADGSPDETLTPAAELPRGSDYFLEGRGAAGRAANGLVIPTAVLRDIGGFDEALRVFEHHDLGLRLNAVASIQGVEDPLYLMASHPGGRLSGSVAVIPGAMERTLVKHRDAFSRHRRAHARFLGALAYRHLEAGHWGAALRWVVRALRVDPADRRVWFYASAALAGPAMLRLVRRIRPREASVSFAELTWRRARKYGRRAFDYPRALVGAPLARIGRTRIAEHRDSDDARRVVLLCGVYRVGNAAVLAPLVQEARDRGWTVRLWGLDGTHPDLEADTVGEGAGPKFPLLNRAVAGVDLERFDWVVVVDDDFAFRPGSVDDLLRTADAAGLELVQPAHTELSYRENQIGVRRPLALARRTTFVEIGPVFAVRRPWSTRVLPFPPEHTMGWGLELDWFDLEREGARLGIVDAVPIRHLAPVGKGYAKAEQMAALRRLLAARGMESIRDVQRTRGTWWVWNRAPGWRVGQ